MSNNGRHPRVLVIAPSLRVGSGVASHIMSYYDNIYHDVDIDFILYYKSNNENESKILSRNGKVLFFEKGLGKNVRKIKAFFKKNAKKYDIIHCHTFNYGLPYLFYAKKYGIRNRIIHIHSVRYSDNAIKNIFNRVFILLCRNVANVYMACSEQAGRKAFGKRPFFVISNCIDISSFSNKNREAIRKQLGIKKGTLLFGNIGRLVKTKNQLFLIDIFYEIRKKQKYKNSRLVIIGCGPEYNALLKRVANKNLKENVIFISSTDKVVDYYAAMDCFIFPSLREGLGMVMIEAQASGLPCFCSDNLPCEVFATELAQGISLNKDALEWCNTITKGDLLRKDVKKELVLAGFSDVHESDRLKTFYIKLKNGEKICA